MLVMSRQVHESVIITVPPSPVPQEIRVTLIKVKSLLAARLGFQADASVVIDREEVRLMKQRPQQPTYTDAALASFGCPLDAESEAP